MVPIKMANPPKRGIAFECILLASFGTSMAPILGASFIATGEKISASTKEVTKAASNVILVISHNTISTSLVCLFIQHHDLQSCLIQNFYRKIVWISFFTTILFNPALIIIFAQIAQG